MGTSVSEEVAKLQQLQRNSTIAQAQSVAGLRTAASEQIGELKKGLDNFQAELPSVAMQLSNQKM